MGRRYNDGIRRAFAAGCKPLRQAAGGGDGPSLPAAQPPPVGPTQEGVFMGVPETGKAAAVSALDELISVADSMLRWISETAPAEAVMADAGLPDESIAAKTVHSYLREIGWTADAERIVAETHAATHARHNHMLAVGFRDCGSKEMALRQEFYGPFPRLASDFDRELLEIRTKEVIAKLRRHAVRLRNALGASVEADNGAQVTTLAATAPAEPDGEGDVDEAAGFLGGSALADALAIHATRRDAFFRRLERERKRLGDDSWHEVREPRPNGPRFLYRADSPKLRGLAAAYVAPKPA